MTNNDKPSENKDALVIDSVSNFLPAAKNKVQCGKCDNIVRRSFCAVKGIQVSRKKPLECDFYTPKVEKEPAPPVYVPSYDKYTSRMIRKMARKMSELGLVPTTGREDVRIDAEGNVYQRQSIPIPKTTANPGVLGMEPVRAPAPGEGTLFFEPIAPSEELDNGQSTGRA